MNAEFLQATAHGVGMQTGYVCSSVRAGDATVTSLQKFTEVKPLQGVEVNPLTCRIPCQTPCFRNGAGSVLIQRQAFRKLLIRLVWLVLTDDRAFLRERIDENSSALR